MPKPFLTDSYKKFIQKNYLKMSKKAMARKFGCVPGVISRYMEAEGLEVPQHLIREFQSKGLTGRTSFTPQMDSFLKENYLKIPIKPLGEKIRKSYTGVQTRMRQLQLEIPAEIIEQRKKIGQIKPGTPGWNKGKKQSDFMSPESIARSAKTRFKKGQTPHNTAQKNGAISIRKDSKTGILYKYIRLRVGKWELLQRVNWEKENGPIPVDHCIRFKDGNSLNCEPENLECVSRAENLRMNWHNYPQPLQKAIRLTKKIKSAL